MLLFVAVGYLTFMNALLDFNTSTPGIVRHTTPCQNRCDVILPNSSVNEFNSFSLDNSQALFVHFHGNSLSRLQKPKETEILDPVNLVWVENTAAPFLSLDLGFNVYSLTTLWRKVRNMSVMVEFGSQKCLENITYSCVTASLATAFLTNVSQQREIFRSGNSKDIIDRENAYKIEKIVQEFFDSEQGDQGSNGETSESSTTNLSNGTGEARSEGRHQLVRADVNPRLTDINGDPTNETTPLIQSNQNARNDIIEV
ncbi:hypothetical protein AC249_AIPGENE24164 [Exaiptasia diaphana]|nr:hypothetical protein AC249_AIPGENE24164 [Exaiptasia diaphana]